MAEGEFTVTFKGDDEKLRRLLRAFFNEYGAMLKDEHEFTRQLLRDYGMPHLMSRRTGILGLEGTIKVSGSLRETPL